MLIEEGNNAIAHTGRKEEYSVVERADGDPS